MKKQLRILMLITNYGNGGAERVFHDHAIEFSKFAHVEEVVFDLEQHARVSNSLLLVNDLKRNDLWSYFGPIGRLISRSRALHNLVKIGKFDIVISHMDGANWINTLSLSKARKILVVHGTIMYDQNLNNFIQWIRLNFVFPVLYNLADCTVTVSQGIAKELSSFGRVQNVKSIPNFFDLNSIRNQAVQPIQKLNQFIFNGDQLLITSGRLVEQKKQFFILDILAALRRLGRKESLVILGDGNLRDELVLKCTELNLSAWCAWEKNNPCENRFDVYFMGHVPNPFQYLKRASLFLFPSSWEGFPLALCEAMIASVTVISADCPTGPREILAPGSARDSYDLRQAEWLENGVLLPMIESPDDLMVWVDVVQQLLADPSKREQLKNNASQAVKRLDRNIVLQQWIDLIDRVAND